MIATGASRPSLPGAASRVLSRPAVVAFAIAAVALATILGALFIEHVLGVKPCELCLKQRIPYYVGVPLATLVGIVAARGRGGLRPAVLLCLLAAVFAGGAALGGYHAGVEWGLWSGPTDCTGPITKPAAITDFLKQLEAVKVVRCDEVAYRLLGLSLAVWNAVVATALAVVALAGAARAFAVSPR
jgi:disulfide bond formation protein DsbB